jgi:hypothetical protein
MNTGFIVAGIVFVAFVVYLGYWHTEAIDCEEGFTSWKEQTQTVYDNLLEKSYTDTYAYRSLDYVGYQNCLGSKNIPSFEGISSWWEDGIDFVGEPEGSRLNE